MMSFEEFPLNEDFQGYAATSKIGSDTSDAESQQKKRRRTRPCSHCRRRKTKCVREDDSSKCLECVKRQLDCSTGGERQLDETGSSCDNCLYKRRQCYQQENSCYECILDGLTCMHTGTKFAIGDRSHPKMDHVSLGINSNREANLIPWSDAFTGHSKRYYRQNNVLYHLTTDKTHTLSKPFVDEIQSIVKPIGPSLISLFFKYFNTVTPILTGQQTEVLTGLSLTSSTNPLLLTMIYLHAFKFCPLEPSLYTSVISKKRLENLAVILSDELKDQSLEMAQGLVLMILYNFTENPQHNEENWTMLQKAIQLVEVTGYHYTCDEDHRVLLWEIIKLDKFISLLEFKPIKTADWDIATLAVSEFTNEDNGKIYLELLVLANQQCGPLINGIFSYKSFKNDDFNQFVPKFNSFLDSIDRWLVSLPTEVESSITINVHYYLLIFLSYRRLINKAIEENINIKTLSTLVDPMIKKLSAFNDILLNNGTQLKSMLQFQVLPNYLIHCFTNYYLVLRLLSAIKFNVTALIQSFELKSKQLSQLKELRQIDLKYLESLQSQY